MNQFFFFNDTATTEIYTLSLHDALPICFVQCCVNLNSRWYHYYSVLLRQTLPCKADLFRWQQTLLQGDGFCNVFKIKTKQTELICGIMSLLSIAAMSHIQLCISCHKHILSLLHSAIKVILFIPVRITFGRVILSYFTCMRAKAFYNIIC